MHPIIFKDGTVAFSTSTIIGHDVVVTLDPMDYVTEFGYFFPYHSDSWNIVDYLRNPQEKTSYRAGGSTNDCLFITDKWQIYHVSATQQGDKFKLRINAFPNVPSFSAVFGALGSSVDTMRLALRISETIPEAIDKYMSTVDIKQSKFYTWKIDDLVEHLKQNRPSIPLLTNHLQEFKEVYIPRVNL